MLKDFGILTMKIYLPFILLLAFTAAYSQQDPQVKMSSSGICHAQGSTYYNQTKKFTAYKTLDECLKAGGKMPKR
jgi:hypothetical protein